MLGTTARDISTAMAVLVNFPAMVVAGFFGSLGITGALSDTSDWENRIAGLQFLSVSAICAATLIAIAASQKLVSRMACASNAVLILMGAYYWIVNGGLVGTIVPPPDSMFLLLLAAINWTAMFWKTDTAGLVDHIDSGNPA